MISEQLLKDITTEAEILKQQYTEKALLSLLDAEQIRLAREKNITLGKSSKDLAKGALIFIGDNLLKENRALAKLITMTYVVNNVFNYLVAQGVISADNIARDYLVVSLVVAIIFDSVAKRWDEYRTK